MATMKRVAVTPDHATLDVPGEELGRLADLVGRELDLQEARTGDLTPEDRADLQAIYEAITRTLTEMWHEEERRGPPFKIGEPVELVPQFADMPGVDTDMTGAVVVNQNREDGRHDYDWCVIRLPDGREIEMPALYMRRPA
jgi:hypothetical protein